MKKFLALTLSLLGCLFFLTACGGGTTPAEDPAEGDPVEGGDAATQTIRVAATPAPHAEILEIAKPILAEQGITLEIVTFTDYVQPNEATEDGSVEANYFQHITYLQSENEARGMHLTSVGAIHYEPFGLYPGKTATIEELPEGATIAVPNDGTNEARALLLLEAQGIIKLEEGIGLEATKLHIAENPKNVDIVEMEAASIPGALDSVDMAVINGNYAIGAGLSVANDTVAVEDAQSEAAELYANVLVVKEGSESNPAILALLDVLKSEAVQTYINETYDGAVVPVQ